LGEHDIQQDNAGGRQQFEQNSQWRPGSGAKRLGPSNGLPRGWPWARPKAPTEPYSMDAK
jgi:hypothetical protein